MPTAHWDSPRRAASARYGTAATWSTALASGSTSLALLDHQDAWKRDEAGMLTLDALRLDRDDRVPLARPRYAVDAGLHPPGRPRLLDRAGGEAALAGKLLVERLAAPEEPHC